MEINNLKQLRQYIEKSIQKSLETKVFDKVRDVELSHTVSDVYEAYKPDEYVRRYEKKGLKDPRNIIYEKQKIKKGWLVVRNITDFNPYRPISRFGYNLTNLIEYGWEESCRRIYNVKVAPDYAQPRPFIANTTEELKQTKIHVKALKEGLKEDGIITK